MKKLFFIVFFLFFSACSSAPVSDESARSPSNFQSCFELVNSMIKYVPIEGPSATKFGKAKSLKELEELYGGDSLIDIQRRLTNEEIRANNDNAIALLETPFKTRAMKGKKKAITLNEADSLYRKVEHSKVNKNHYCYDTAGTIGFCFGRATIAHMEATIIDIHPDSVKKIWVAGNMGVWGHHVATIVNTEKGWMVLDTNFGKKVDVSFWIKEHLKQSEDDKEIMVFITQAGRFGPYDNTPYNAVDLFNTTSNDFKKAEDFYKGYFHDYFDGLDDQVKALGK